MRNIKSHNLKKDHAYGVDGVGGAVTLFTLVGVTLVAYLHDVKHENLMFLLFQNSVMSDLIRDVIRCQI